MINIDNILTTPVQELPWQHKQVENVLSSEVLDKITSEVIRVKNNIIEQKLSSDGVLIFQSGFNQEVLDIIFSMNKQFLTVAPNLMKQFNTDNVSNMGYFSIPRLNFTQQGYVGKIHDDGDTKDKSLIMTIYIYPNISSGTRFYKDNTLFKVTDWLPNRAILFAPKTDETWHSFNADSADRVTLSFFYERMEDMSYINRLSTDIRSWFYGNFTKIT
jgi:hypothetical protein